MWTNWSGGQQARPRATERPLDESGVVAAIRRAADRGVRVRPTGAGLSWSPLSVTDEVLLDCSALTGVVSADDGRVRVRAGAPLRALLAALAEQGRTLAAVPAWDAMTVAGAVATGTHGSGARLGSLSALVRGVRLVDGGGTVRWVEGPDLDAVRTGLGALGVVTEVELAVEPAGFLEVGEELRPLADLLAEGFLDAHHRAEIEVFPGGQALARWADPVEPDDPAGEQAALPARPGTVRAGTVRAAVGSAQALGRVVPPLAPVLRRSAGRWGGPTTGRPHEVLVDDRPERVEQTEWALPRAALDSALRELESAVTARGIAVRPPVRVRVGAAETGWLHPAYGRATAWVAVRAPRGGDHLAAFGLVGSVLAGAGGRPHWAGRHDWTVAEVEASYPRLADFRRVRDRLDPDRRFTNPHLDALLGP
ncbi:MAG TPA: D-arabinono-1,4-lactone oxidase [Pseudonocardia sp.]|nr:D-arabinono-1,4-lactone oxidase [Pseudonocardia sp.]